MNRLFARKLIVFSCLWMATGQISVAQTASDSYPLTKAKRILFLGNSITYAGDYVSLFERFYISHYPKPWAEVINVGLPSETVSGLSEPNHADGAFPRPWLFTRLANVLTKTKADVVFACYGMNDGIYLPFDQTRFKAFQKGIERLRKMLEEAGVKRIIFLTPPVHDDPRKGVDGYNLVLDRYAQWLLDQRGKRGWEVIDIHFPMRSYLLERRKSDPSFRLAADGVHPGEEGHWLMARELMSYLDPNFDKSITLESHLNSIPSGAKLYELVRKRQIIMKDAWLTYTGHSRPGMAVGLPMEQASKKYEQIERQIRQASSSPLQ